MALTNTANVFEIDYEPAMRPCSKCGVEIHYQMMTKWPGLGPNLCNKCGNDADQIAHDKAVEQIINQMVENSRIPIGFDNWEPVQAQNLNTLNMLEWLLKNGRERSLFWSGTNGDGKSHTTGYAGLKFIRESKATVKFYECSRWLTLMMQLKMQKNIDLFNTEVKQASTCDIAIFDDIGKEKPTEAKTELLYNVIDLRDQQGKATWFTSNYSMEQLIDRMGDNYGNAIVTRLKRMCK